MFCRKDDCGAVKLKFKKEGVEEILALSAL
jgi:hypothetical protein